MIRTTSSTREEVRKQHPRKYRKKATYIGLREILYNPVIHKPALSGLANWIIEIMYKTKPVKNNPSPVKPVNPLISILENNGITSRAKVATGLIR